MPELLEVNALTVAVFDDGREKTLVDSVSFSMPELSICALVGGSGSGKTTTALSILNLLPMGLTVKSGRILYRQQDLLLKTFDEMRAVRGKEIGMVFQEPLYAFNPVFSIGYQIEEVLRFHTNLTAHQRKERVYDLLDSVELKDPKTIAERYPHQLSGGMRQRAMIAQAIAAGPKLIIADEPTSNLDVTIQARIIELFQELKSKFALSILLITHDLGLVKYLADKVIVMDRGRVVESGATGEVLSAPKDHYTRQLIDAVGG